MKPYRVPLPIRCERYRVTWGDIVLLAKPVTLTEGDRVTLTTDVPVATDGTSKPEKLLYAVSLPPVHGQIEHINYPGVPISSYSQLDVVAQKVSDVHDNSHGAACFSFRFALKVIYAPFATKVSDNLNYLKTIPAQGPSLETKESRTSLHRTFDHSCESVVTGGKDSYQKQRIIST
ncbi:hypothetical protein DV515_00004679 [Chloebia gouldiae]|uniref:Uncharacterized protein n=1 Tax=Chloebia gouldiae TaxID=44316 RepID=A0A3L8SQQ5_CHLGU|nr:hypothetical protein DV515_00004679 [Chloebia gouldiae]